MDGFRLAVFSPNIQLMASAKFDELAASIRKPVVLVAPFGRGFHEKALPVKQKNSS